VAKSQTGVRDMKPVKFNGQNIIFAENQPEYIPLPAYKDINGVVTTCWDFSLIERFKILFGANLYWQQLTFNHQLQPVKPSIGVNPKPEVKDDTRS
jgi:hypothetical protein